MSLPVQQAADAEPFLRPLASPKIPALPALPGTCDAHFHVFGPAARFPYSPDRAYTPADAPLEALLRMHARLGIERGVVVQGNPHGTDNRALLDALAREPNRLRGVAIVPETVTREELKIMRDAGVRALRFHHRPRIAGRVSAQGVASFKRLAPWMAELGLHVQFFMDARQLPELLAELKEWTLPVVLDHFGSTLAAEGIEAEGFRLLVRHLSEGRIWVKVSGVYRASALYPGYADARALHEALVAANPDQLVWGTDWPHTRLLRDMPDDGVLMDLFNDWTPDARARRKMLVSNPERLYGF